MGACNDIDLKIYVSAEMYLALKYRCQQADRTLSEHVRHLIRSDLQEGLTQEREHGRAGAGEVEGKGA